MTAAEDFQASVLPLLDESDLRPAVSFMAGYITGMLEHLDTLREEVKNGPIHPSRPQRSPSQEGGRGDVA